MLLVLLPAVFNPAGALAFEPLKASILRVAAAVLAAAWLGHRFLRTPSADAVPQPEVDVGAQPVVRAGIALIGVAALSTALSVEPGLSFFGTFDRGMGWLSLAAGGVLLLVTADLLSDERRRERAITALVLGAIVPCAYALVQRIGLDPVTWTTLGAPGSSLGSPTFLGGYLVLVVPFAMHRVVSQARLGAGLRYAGWLALLLVACAVLLATTIRGPILGLVAGVVTFAVLARPRKRTGRLEVAAASGLIVAALAIAVAATGASGTLGLQRFVNIARGGDSSVERLTVWRDALRIPLAEAKTALIGFGLETQSTALERGEATVRLTQNQQWDRAHNVLLDAWLTGGVLGVAALVAVLATAMVCAWRARQASLGTGNLLPAAVLAALVAHLVEVSFAFHTVVTGALFWVVLGLAASLTPRLRTRPSAGRPALALLGATVGVLLVPLVATPAVADTLYGAARRASYDAGARQEELAAAWAPWVEELPRAAGLDWQQVASRREDAGARGRAESDLLEAAERAPAEPVPQLRLVRLYLTRGNLESAERACQRALATGPYRASVWDTCADVSARRGLTEEAPLRRARGEDLRQPR